MPPSRLVSIPGKSLAPRRLSDSAWEKMLILWAVHQVLKQSVEASVWPVAKWLRCLPTRCHRSMPLRGGPTCTMRHFHKGSHLSLQIYTATTGLRWSPACTGASNGMFLEDQCPSGNPSMPAGRSKNPTDVFCRSTCLPWQGSSRHLWFITSR